MISRRMLPVFLSTMLSLGSIPIAMAAGDEPQLNFKIYNPQPTPEAAVDQTTSAVPTSNENIIPSIETSNGQASASVPGEQSEQATQQPTSQEASAQTTTAPLLGQETPMSAAAETSKGENSTASTATLPTAVTDSATGNEMPVEHNAAAVNEAASSAETAVNMTAPATSESTSSTTSAATTSDQLKSEIPSEAQATKSAEAETTNQMAPATTNESAQPATTADANSEPAGSDGASGDKVASGKAIQGYIRVVPTGTKIPIIMDTAVDSETSQEGDEFTARTAEDLNIDGGVAVPAGSIIKGRIAQMNAPKHANRSGSVALKFDTVTTPDSRQIPLVANLVAHGGVVHAKRGLKDIAIDSGTVALPVLLGLGIGYLAGTSSSSTSTSTSSSKMGKPEAAMIGAGIGLVVGAAILIAKKGKKVDVRPGDELKIELAEDLRMPMM